MCTVGHIVCMVVHMTTPFPLASGEDIADLVRRLGNTRLPQVPADTGWTRGTDLGALSALLSHWQYVYDWHPHQERIAALPWATAAGLNLVHQASPVSDAPAVVLLHGWPDSVLRFEKVLPLLDDVNVVVPALPGFPFSEPLTVTGMSAATIATMIAEAMHELGYERYVISAGDVGADVAEQLAAAHPDRVTALHLTNISPLHAVFADRSVLDDEELAYLDVVARWSRAEGGYIAEQGSKPHTLAVGLADSPAGLAAWLLEKLHGWSEVTPDPDDLLTWISAYWFSNTIGSSFATYVDFAVSVPYVGTPTVLSKFAFDTKPAPRQFVARYVNLHAFVEHEHGGHFAAWEQPDVYLRDLRLAIAL